MNSKTVFIAERPTQILTAINIIDNSTTIQDATLIIANQFDDAAKIVANFAKFRKHLNFKIVETYEQAIAQTRLEKPTHLFIHWDVGFGTQKTLWEFRKNNPGLIIAVFEEGVGTYRQDIYPPIKRKLFKATGLPINVGGSKFTNEIYVYDKTKYLKSATKYPKAVHQIETGLHSFIDQHNKKLAAIFSSDKFLDSISNSNERICSIYLSNWKFNESDIDFLDAEPGQKILKLHPHCKWSATSKNIQVVPNSLPAEILIAEACKNYERVTVFHPGSSATLYIKSENLLFKETPIHR